MSTSGDGVSPVGSAVKITYQDPSISCNSGAHRSFEKFIPVGGSNNNRLSAFSQLLSMISTFILDKSALVNSRENRTS